MTYPAILFKRPNGEQVPFNIFNLTQDTEDYFNENKVGVSFEDIMGLTVCYFDDGTLMDDDETPDELIILAKPGELCEDVMARAVIELKARKMATKQKSG